MCETSYVGAIVSIDVEVLFEFLETNSINKEKNTFFLTLKFFIFNQKLGGNFITIAKKKLLFF